MRPGPERRSSTLAPVSPATEAETWRKPVEPSAHAPPQPPPAPLPLLEQIDSFSVDMDGDVEVVDFTEHGKLIGVESPQSSKAEPAALVLFTTHKPPRPSAADFFDDNEAALSKLAPPTPSKADEGPWRRKMSPVREHPTTQAERSPERPVLHISPTLYHANPATPHQRPGHPHSDERERQHSQQHYAPHPNAVLKSPLTPSYREAPMSALNDTMARIKGALAGMHGPPKGAAPNQKWLPPALRPRSSPTTEQPPEHALDEGALHETFDVTGYEPPRSPKPAWNHYAVKLSKPSAPREPVPFRRLKAFNSHHYMRLDVSSLIPPREGGKRAFNVFNVNELLFRPYFVKGRPEYRVSLPKPSRAQVTENGLVVNLPSPARPPKITETGAFGRRGEADGAATWRKPRSLPPKVDSKEVVSVNGLDTVSRSPPPEPSRSLEEVSAGSPTVSVPPVKAKAPERISNGSGVAFYRGSPVGNANTSTSAAVQFIVNSELDEESSADNTRAEWSAGVTSSSRPVETTALVTFPEHRMEVRESPVSAGM